MQEIKKRRIVLASVLKPVDEPRMFERMGQSLAANGFDVFIIGFPPASTQSVKGIQFLSHKKFKRISLERVFVRLNILKKIFSIRPNILIVSTHELLGVAIIYWLLTGKKIIYDVQENYWRNIIHSNAFSKPLKYVIAFFVRLKETVASIFVSKFLLAEKCYTDEISFIGNRYSIIENKCKTPDYFQRKADENSINLVFTGTLAESTGIFNAIELSKKLFQFDSKIKLTIVGCCAQSKTLEQIRNEVANCSFIKLIGGEDFVSHQEIFKAIASAHFGIICYPLSPHLENKTPTKLYEYLACLLPILLQNHEPWKKICESVNASITIDFNNPSIDKMIKQMKENNFYTIDPIDVTWQSEEKKFIDAINSN